MFGRNRQSPIQDTPGYTGHSQSLEYQHGPDNYIYGHISSILAAQVIEADRTRPWYEIKELLPAPSRERPLSTLEYMRLCCKGLSKVAHEQSALGVSFFGGLYVPEDGGNIVVMPASTEPIHNSPEWQSAYQRVINTATATFVVLNDKVSDSEQLGIRDTAYPNGAIAYDLSEVDGICEWKYTSHPGRGKLQIEVTAHEGWLAGDHADYEYPDTEPEIKALG